jgi:hypothetical protein
VIRPTARLACVLIIAALAATPALPVQAQLGFASVNSDSPDGASAVRFLAERLGHPTQVLNDDFALGSPHGVLFMLAPDLPISYDDASRLHQWVTGGGRLVYAIGEQPDEAVAASFTINFDPNTPGPGPAYSPGALLRGVDSVWFAPSGVFTPTTVDQVPVLLTQSGRVAATEERVGSGLVIALSTATLLDNFRLPAYDNGRLAADLIGLAAAGGEVRFDESHRLTGQSPRSGVIPFWDRAWGFALVWTAALLFAGLFLRGRAFGPPIRTAAPRDRSSAEYVSAVGRLLQRTRARAVTLDVLFAATRRAVAERVGFRGDPSEEELSRVLATRSPALDEALKDVTQTAATSSGSERDLALAAGKLHKIAYPPFTEGADDGG